LGFKPKTTPLEQVATFKRELAQKIPNLPNFYTGTHLQVAMFKLGM
jgi:hypothetical protein